MRTTRRVAAALIACGAMTCEPAAIACTLGAMFAGSIGAAQAADTRIIERKRVRPRVIVRRAVYARPVFRTNHIPGVWRGDTRLPWVGPGICHDSRTSGRIYCILW